MPDFRPMLSATLTVEALPSLQYPLLVSPKLDGYRCLVRGGRALSRNLKPIRNKFVERVLSDEAYEGFDGELIVGSPTEGNVLGRTSSGVTAFEGEPDFTFWVFDNTMSDMGFARRYQSIEARIKNLKKDKNAAHIRKVPHVYVKTAEELEAAESIYLDQGYEGLMLRSPEGLYKHGRATEREGSLFKLKRFRDFEVTVVRVAEGLVNDNERSLNELGYAKRSASALGMRPSGQVGTIWGEDAKGTLHKCGPGRLTKPERIQYWMSPELIIGQRVTVQVFDYGAKDVPRFPLFKAFRSEDDA